jgi:hypothetical protein
MGSPHRVSLAQNSKTRRIHGSQAFADAAENTGPDDSWTHSPAATVSLAASDRSAFSARPDAIPNCGFKMPGSRIRQANVAERWMDYSGTLKFQSNP